MTGKTDLKAVHEQAMERVNEAWSFERANIEAGREDQLFYNGEQWDEQAKKDRANRPMLTVNRLSAPVHQLTGDIRQNTPSIRVLPSKNGTKDGAEIRNGLIRNIEVNSDADACYAMAGENAAVSGQGGFIIDTEYSNNDGFEQDIRIRPVRDPFGILIDPMAQLPDRSDMQYAYEFDRMSKEAFEKAYPDKSLSDMPMVSVGAFNWMPAMGAGQSVRIAKYWRKKAIKKTLYLMANGVVLDDQAKVKEAVTAGAKLEREREVESYEVESYIINGSEVLSGPHPWPGQYIPICFVPGEEITIDGVTSRKGMVRGAKDAQRLYNYARTVAAETTALQPKQPFVLTKNQIKGYESMWDRAGTDNLPYLLVNDGGASLPQRAQPAMPQTGLDSQAAIAAADIEIATGVFKPNLGAPSNETSGKAILARQREGDTGTFLYPDNLARAVRYCGIVICDLLGKVYDTERMVRILKEDGDHDMTMVNKRVPDPEAVGQFIKLNDLSAGEYDITVSTGPSYATKRMEAADAMLTLARDMPIVGQAAPDLIVKALDLPYGQELSDRIKKALPPGPTEDGPPQPPPPDPAQQAEAAKAAASAMKDGAATDKIRAETQGIYLKNAQMYASMQAVATQLPQILAALQQLTQGQGGAPGGSPPEGEQPPPMGEAPPPGGPTLPEAPALMNGVDDMPPMAELDQAGAPQ